MSSAVPQSAYFATMHVFLGDAGLARLLLELADLLRDMRHQRHGLHVDDQQPKPPEQDQQGSGGGRDRIRRGILSAVAGVQRDFERDLLRRLRRRLLLPGVRERRRWPGRNSSSRPGRAFHSAPHRSRRASANRAGSPARPAGMASAARRAAAAVLRMPAGAEHCTAAHRRRCRPRAGRPGPAAAPAAAWARAAADRAAHAPAGFGRMTVFPPEPKGSSLPLISCLP